MTWKHDLIPFFNWINDLLSYSDLKDNIRVMGSMSEKLGLSVLRVFASELDLTWKEADMT